MKNVTIGGIKLRVSDRRAKQVSSFRKRVRDRERRFKQMTPEGKRVAIAKDVIEAIADEFIQPTEGTYLAINGNHDAMTIDNVGATQIQDLLTAQESCTACAIGAMFVCAVLRADSLTVKQFDRYAEYLDPCFLNRGSKMAKFLKEFFSPTQIALIESALECSEMGPMYVGAKAYNEAVSFGMRYLSTKSRLKAIMANIIKNGGEFKPGAQP